MTSAIICLNPYPAFFDSCPILILVWIVSKNDSFKAVDVVDVDGDVDGDVIRRAVLPVESCSVENDDDDENA
jgi:hypothetical protein